MSSWWVVVIAPRRLKGAISDRYRGTMVNDIPANKQETNKRCGHMHLQQLLRGQYPTVAIFIASTTDQT